MVENDQLVIEAYIVVHAPDSGSQKIVYKTFLGSPHPSKRILAGSSSAISRVKQRAEVFPIG
jgi:hypothetical protein